MKALSPTAVAAARARRAMRNIDKLAKAIPEPSPLPLTTDNLWMPEGEAAADRLRALATRNSQRAGPERASAVERQAAFALGTTVLAYQQLRAANDFKNLPGTALLVAQIAAYRAGVTDVELTPQPAYVGYEEMRRQLEGVALEKARHHEALRETVKPKVLAEPSTPARVAISSAAEPVLRLRKLLYLDASARALLALEPLDATGRARPALVQLVAAVAAARPQAEADAAALRARSTRVLDEPLSRHLPDAPLMRDQAFAGLSYKDVITKAAAILRAEPQAQTLVLPHPNWLPNCGAEKVAVLHAEAVAKMLQVLDADIASLDRHAPGAQRAVSFAKTRAFIALSGTGPLKELLDTVLGFVGKLYGDDYTETVRPGAFLTERLHQHEVVPARRPPL